MQPVKRAEVGDNRPPQRTEITQCCAQVLMAQEALHREERHAVFDEVRREGMPERMRCYEARRVDSRPRKFERTLRRAR